MKSPTQKKILLFIQKDSNYFSANLDDFKKIIEALGKISPFEAQVIDISQAPELAEKYRIDALPTLIIGDKRYIGKPTPQRAVEVFKKEL